MCSATQADAKSAERRRTGERGEETNQKQKKTKRERKGKRRKPRRHTRTHLSSASSSDIWRIIRFRLLARASVVIILRPTSPEPSVSAYCSAMVDVASTTMAAASSRRTPSHLRWKKRQAKSAAQKKVRRKATGRLENRKKRR